MKIIVNNCPNMTIVKGQDLMCFDVEKMHGVPCQNRTDCIIKQIVELCKSTCRKRCTNDCLGTRKHCGYGQILNLLGIEEVDE